MCKRQMCKRKELEDKIAIMMRKRTKIERAIFNLAEKLYDTNQSTQEIWNEVKESGIELSSVVIQSKTGKIVSKEEYDNTINIMSQLAKANSLIRTSSIIQSVLAKTFYELNRLLDHKET